LVLELYIISKRRNFQIGHYFEKDAIFDDFQQQQQKNKTMSSELANIHRSMF